MKINYFFLAVLLILFFGCSPGSDDENPENEDLTEDISGDANSDDNDDDSSSDDSNDDDTGDDSDDDSSSDDDNSSEGTVFIAGHDVANETVLRNIPEEYINKAREEFHVAYQHTSHGTHVSRGVFGLIDYKDGDDVLFGVSRNERTNGKLTFYDYALEDYAADGEKATDLSANETAFIQATRNFLDDSDNAHVNVIMWSWCNIANHDVEGNYLPGMTQLISEYGEGGSKIGSGDGKREVPVHFIFMTGHANKNNNVGEGKPKNQAELINDYCLENKQFCLDYYSIDTHDMDGNYWEDAGDDGNSDSYGGNFYADWQNSHQLGVHYWENRMSPGGDVAFGSHNSQHITSNRKAMAFWWILARLAGWDGETEL